MTRTRVLVVEDTDTVRFLVGELLQRAGMDVIEASDGQEGLRKFFAHRPDLVILDVAMPVLDGWETLERIRELSDVPVMMLTAKGAELEKVRGLKGGADDYLTKPFGRQELLARVEALLRRKREGPEVPEVHLDELVTIDFQRHQVTVAGREVSLTPLEFKLLATFARHPNQVLSRGQLLDLVWGDAAASRDQVKLYVGYLRRKLRGATDAEPIETVRGFGYRYRPSLAGEDIGSAG